ncbi:MAG TPA: hypothetical protein VKB35_02225 [Ktedonobacteraceae bacterium]|nr:hypothetical protein [Ktedonobacteraceae bacterium]
MTYYRVALQSDQSPHWMWTSTVLVSLDAMFGFLKLHHLVKRDRLRVFFSSAFEYLNAMLDRENQGLGSNSLTAEHLLNGSGRIDQLEMQRFESACDLHPYLGAALTSLLTAQLWHEQRQHAPSEERTNAREMRPVAVELSGSADHDVPYHFALPLSLPQVLAWARLLGRVQRGELEP